MINILSRTESEPLSASDRLQLYSELLLLGNYYGLVMTLPEAQVSHELKAFSKDWKPYNPSKPGYGRQGLSLTSLDGGLSGVPDLTSLFEYNKEHGTNYSEDSFSKLTPVYSACSSIHELLNPFLPYLGRTHFLKFDRGGFFPYHRDNFQPPESFRIFVPLYDHSTRDFIFLLGSNKIQLEKGRPYFINTMMEHALFCLDGPSLHLVLNVHLCRESVDLVKSKLASF